MYIGPYDSWAGGRGVKLDIDKTKESETYLFSLLMIEESYMQRK